MMPSPLPQRLLEASWDKITASVTAGLKGDKKEAKLADVIPLSERPYGLPQTRLRPWPPLQSSPRRRMNFLQPGGDYTELRFDHRFPLDVDALQANDSDEAVTEWAGRARRRELTAVLELLAAIGRESLVDAGDIQAALPTGRGAPEFVVWEPLLAGLDVLKATFGQAPAVVAKPDVEQRVRGLILRPAGGPSIRRGQDFTLDWLPYGEGVELVLMAHLRVYNATWTSVTTLVDYPAQGW